MRSTIEKAPQPVSKEAPIGRQATSTYFTIGGSQVKDRQPVGWEAITPKRSNKPVYLLKAQQALQAAWDAYDQAKRKCDEAWAAAEQGLDALPIPF